MPVSYTHLDVYKRQGLRAHYERESKGSIDSRVDNLDELVSVASRFNRGEDDESAQLTELVAFLALYLIHI